MKAVLGFLFLLAGGMLGYLVLTGKLVTNAQTGLAEVAVPTHINEQPGEPAKSSGSSGIVTGPVGGGPLGLSMLTTLSDHQAARGYL